MNNSKHLLIALFVIALSSCSPKLQYQTSISYIDYSLYANEGMFLTESNSVAFDYKALGTVSISVLSGNVDKKRPDRYNFTDLNGNRPEEKYSEWVAASPEKAIQLAIEKAKAQGGDGIINMKIEPFTEVTNKATRSGFLLSGMVIKKQ